MSLTLLILFVTVAVSFAALGNQGLYYKFLLNPYQAIHRSEYWRFLTSGFIHNGYVHLGFNMFTFYFFGSLVEETFIYRLGESSGTTFFILLYVSAIVISDLPVAFKHKNNPGYNSLGASGAVSAVVFASILYYPTNKIYLFGLVGLPGFILGAIYVIYSYTQGKNMADNINHEAHLYGALYGLIFGLVVYPEAGPQFFEQIMNYRFNF